jgi:hypothetical protein
MTNKKFWLGMLIMALVFGTAIIGCDTGGNNGSVGGSNDITYTVEANGTAETETSTKLKFTFSEAVSGLKVEDINIFDRIGGGAEKNSSVKGGALTGSGTSWTLNITKVREGKIRVSIEKKGIEGGRKTVFVYKDNATGESSDKAITLADALWLENEYAIKSSPKWYKFEAEQGVNYRVQWKCRDRNTSADSSMVEVFVTAYKNDLETIITDDQEVTSIYGRPGLQGWLISGEGKTVYLKVEVTDGATYYSGTFSIRFLDIANMGGPQDIIQINGAGAQPNRSVVVSWWATAPQYPNTIESSGYRVYRSETKNGTYTQIGADIPATPGIVDSKNYTDEDVEIGKSYWYRVAGYNSKGEGEMSEPKESDVIQDIEAGILLTLGVEENGEIMNPTQVDWYKFTAQSGKSYGIEWISDSYMVLDISVFDSDKNPIEYYEGKSISGVNGTVYLQVELNPYFFGVTGVYGPYTIKVSEQ